MLLASSVAYANVELFLHSQNNLDIHQIGLLALYAQLYNLFLIGELYERGFQQHHDVLGERRVNLVGQELYFVWISLLCGYSSAI